jgi:hypothetical protein
LKEEVLGRQGKKEVKKGSGGGRSEEGWWESFLRCFRIWSVDL